MVPSALGESALLAMSITTTTPTMSTTIPTVSREIRPPNPYKKWWLRSPFTIVSDFACFVDLSGDVHGLNGSNYVYVSYG